MTTHLSAEQYRNIFSDLSVIPSDLHQLIIPEQIRVPSKSDIKVCTILDLLRYIKPEAHINVVGVAVASNVNEQPVGLETVDGAINRLLGGKAVDETPAAWFSIENGLFKWTGTQAKLVLPHRGYQSWTHGADLSTDYDPDVKYEDRAVVVVDIPTYPTVVELSTHDEAVEFPGVAVAAAHDDLGGFVVHTAGSKLFDLGEVLDKQNPHTDLTGGRLSRQEQITRAMVRALSRLV